MKIATFKVKCTNPNCQLDFETPLLSDFSYGEFIYNSIDGKQYKYYNALDCDTWRFIDRYVCETFEKTNWKDTGAVIQKIIGLVADRVKPGIYFTQDVYCSYCHSNLGSIDFGQKTGLQEYENLSFNAFTELTTIEKKNLIDNLMTSL